MAGFWATTTGSSGFVDDTAADWRELVEHAGFDPDEPNARPDLVADGAVVGWCWDPDTAEDEIVVYLPDVGHRRIRRIGK